MAVDSTTNRYTGEDLYLSYRGVEIQTDFRSFGESGSADMADITAGDDTDKAHIITLLGVQFSGTFLQQGVAGGTAIREAVKLGASGTLIVGPEGTATGKPKYTCLASVTSNDKSYPYDGAVQFDVSWERNGSWVENYDRSGDTF